MLAPSSAQAPYPSLPRKARKLIHSAAPPLKIAIALLDCDFVLCTSAQRGLLLHHCAHTCGLGRKPHTVATRASRRGAGALLADRVDRDDFFPWWEDRHHRPFSGRSGVLRCSFETRLKCRFALEHQRFFGFDARSCSASSPRFRQGRSFPRALLQGR